MRAQNAPPGAPKRQRKPGVAKISAQPECLEDVPDLRAVGYGSQEAMEAVCDAHVIWSRATLPMRVIIGGLTDGKSKVDMASDAKTDRFMVARINKAWQRQLAA